MDSHNIDLNVIFQTYVMAMFDEVSDGIATICPHIHSTIGVPCYQISLVIVKQTYHMLWPHVCL